MRIEHLRRRVGQAALLGQLSRVVPAHAEPTPVDSVGEDTRRAFSGTNLILYGAAVASTVALVPTGGDHEARRLVQRDLASRTWGDAAYYGGYVLPVLLPAGVYVTGLVAKHDPTTGAGSAAIQAVVLTEIAVVLLKVGTGRPFPRNATGEAPHAEDRPEYSRELSPFGFKGRYAWPSGHTAAAFSIAGALASFARDDPAVAFVAYPIATGIGVGMLVGDHHWASDVVAGALIGQAVGWSVGASFRERARGERGPVSRFQLSPLVGGGVTGALLSVEL